MKSKRFARSVSPFLFLSTIFCASPSHAELRRFSVLGGVDLGYHWLSTSVTGEQKKSGFLGSLKGYASFQWDSLVLDVGPGYFYSLLNGDDADITTHAGLFEASPRWIYKDHWQFGPVLGLKYGTGVTFVPSVTSTEKDLFFFGGLQALYEIADRSTVMRMGLRSFTDFDISNRQVWAVQATFHWGLSFFGSDLVEKSEKVREIIKTETKVVYVERPAGTPADIQIDLDLTLVRFETARAEVFPISKKMLEELGQVLAKHSSQWDQIEISGGTGGRADSSIGKQV
jgi:hypothetical protein